MSSVTSMIEWSPSACMISVGTNSTVCYIDDDDVFTLNECKPTTNGELSSLNSYTKCHYVINLMFIAMVFIVECH